MNCNCDLPARYLISRDGKPCFTCGVGRCRFYALAPVQCDGYTRVTLGAPGSPPADVGVVLRFEALVHPDGGAEACFMVKVQGDAQRWDALRTAVLQNPQFEGMWYTTAKAFLYPMTQYARLVHAIKARSLPNTQLEEIPSFYFRCVERLRQVRQRYDEDVAAGRARRPDPDDCVFRQLKPFQRDGVRFVISHDGRAMIADDMGLGKTVQAIAVAHHYRDEWPVLVVCPMSLLENWAKEFSRFCGIPYTRIAILQGTKATATSLQDVVIVSYNSLKCVEQARFNVVILDESHYIKAGAAKRAQLSLKICRDSRRVLLLSGTPAMSRPIELYAQLQAIQPNIVPSRTHFSARYCNSFVSRFGIDVTGHSHTDELHSLLRHYVIRRTKKELGNELPSKSRQLLYVYITDREKKALEKQIVALRRSLSSSSSSSSLASSAGCMTVSTDLAARAPNAFEMKMATARAKVPAVQDYVGSIVEQHLDSGEKVILFAHHQCMMEALKAAVEAVRPRQPIDYIYISGDTPAAQREPAAEHFRTEPTCTVAILSMQSSGTGHNFTCASTVVFTELDWNPSTHLQCEDRVHRIGQSQACHIKYLLAEGTSDSVIWPLLQAKLTVTTAMFDSSGTAADVRLHDGADAQNVARRDVAPAGVPTAASTPPASQQSTLDRFLSPPHASQSSNQTPRPSTHSQPLQQRQSVMLQGERDNMESPGQMPLLTPTDPSQRLADSLLGTPLSLMRESSANAPAADGEETKHGAVAARAVAEAPRVVVSFSEMGSVVADAPARPQRHSGTGLMASAGAAGSGAASRRGAAASAVPGSSSGNSGRAGSDATSAAAAPVPPATSVLDLMRQTTNKPNAPASTPARVEVVDLTEGDRGGRGGLVTIPALPMAQPVVQSPSATLPLTVSRVPAAVCGTAPPPAAPRRTVFTFSPSSSSSTTTTTNTATTTATPSVSAPPTPAAASPPAAAMPPQATTPALRESHTSAPHAVGAVRVSLRPTLHFKRPRTDAELSGSHNSHTEVAQSFSPGHISTPPLVHPPVMPTPAGAFAASTEMAVAPLWSPHPHRTDPTPSPTFPALLGAGGAAPTVVPTAGGSAAAPRRTLFKLVSNTPTQQPRGKDST